MIRITNIMIFVVILLASELMLECHGYVHINSMKIHELPTPKNDALFGYSIAYQPGIQRLIITAPQENHIGNIYTIGLNSSNIIKVNVETIPFLTLPNITRNFWLGATVKANSNFFITCAPRYVEMKSNGKNRPKVRANLGLCISSEYIDSDKYQYKILQHMSNYERDINAKKFGQKLDSLGWSIEITKYGEVLIGSPAMMTGRVLLYENPVSNPFLIHKVAQESTYRHNFGYSLTSGYFFNQNMIYVISSTFGYGKVYLFDSKPKNIAVVKDTEVGSTFGAALCTARLDASALLVGAPTYSENAYRHDIGAVYVYVDQTDEGSKQMLYKRTLKGPSSGSYFGHAIENLGDIDGDGKDEIVIAAPFENGIGAVYIYSGTSILDEKFRPKRIQPENFQSFGFSLTVLDDTDGNGSNELAVGSPKDNKVVVFNTFASITVILSAQLDQKTNDSDKDYILEYCIKSQSEQENITADLVILIELRNAKFTKDESKNGVYQTILQLQNNHTISNCHKLVLHVISAGSSTSANKLIMSYNITATLKDDPEKMTNFDPLRVLISDQSVLNAYEEKWNYDSSTDEPNLRLEISPSMMEPYMIGSSSLESFSLSIFNTGGAVSKSCLSVFVYGAQVAGYPRSCSHTSEGLLCRHNQIISTNGILTYDFQIDTKYFTSIHKSLTIRCNLYPRCGIERHKSYERSIELKPYTDMVDIKGQSTSDKIVNMTLEDLRSGKSLEHVYTIYNYGLTNWVGVKSEITLENLPYIDYTKNPIKIYAFTSSTECEIGTNEKNEEIKVWCEIGNMKRQEKVIVVIVMEIMPGTLEFKSYDQNVTITTSLNLMLQDEVKYLSLNTVLKFVTAEVPLWVTLVSSFVGIFLIIIISYVLYEYGFLRRKTKEKLKEKKEEVYRQSVRRSMMCANVRRAMNDERRKENDFHKLEDEDSV